MKQQYPSLVPGATLGLALLIISALGSVLVFVWGVTLPLGGTFITKYSTLQFLEFGLPPFVGPISNYNYTERCFNNFSACFISTLIFEKVVEKRERKQDCNLL